MSATDPSEALEIVLPPERWLSWDTRQRTDKSRYGPLVDFGDPVMNSRAGPVAYIRRDDGTGGTGFLIAPDLLLTNNHVLPTPDHADRCTVWFNFISGRAGLPQAAEADPYNCRPLFAVGALLEDGTVAAGDRKANEGIMITAILEDLAQNLPEAEIPAAQRDSEDVLQWP